MGAHEPGIQAAPSVIIPRTPALDAWVKPGYDKAEGAALISVHRLGGGEGSTMGERA